jgi:SNF2 family DNA or RNA helicase
MAILHGSWIFETLTDGSYIDTTSGFPDHRASFFIWGETWRSAKPSTRKQAKPAIATSLYALEAHELKTVLAGLIDRQVILLSEAQAQAIATAPERPSPQPNQLGWTTVTINLPAHIEDNQAAPCHSSMPFDQDVALYPTAITGLCCPVALTAEFLAALPLNTPNDEGDIPGPDLKFWAHVGRWSLDLMARGKFVPVIAHRDQQLTAQWQPLLDSGQDHQRFQAFTQTMPLISRCYQSLPNPNSNLVPQTDLPPDSSELLMRGLQTLLDYYLRPCLEADAPQLLRKLGSHAVIESWISGLGNLDPALQTTEINAFQILLDEWLHPIRHHLEQNNAFRPCFDLTPPGPGQGGWQMAYFLQALDDPSILISADMVWNTASETLQYLNRTLDRPQETLLSGLGLASKIYPQIEESLQGARPSSHGLTAHQAYDFIKAIAWRLEDSGFGVLMPESLTNREGLANRLGLHVKADTVTPSGKKTLGLDSLLNFKWELSIGGQTLSKAEFERLVNLDSPLVEINGEWVELRAQDVKAAQSFFGTRRQQTGLSLQDAIRIKSGDTHAFEKLPVVNFEASGILEELLSTLSGNQTFEPIQAPEGFQGTLRPYQARGVGWLAMLEKWGLGACLADDMGLGKTIQMIAFLLHLKRSDRLNGPTLLICPTSVLGNWEREVRKFAPELKVRVHHGAQRLQGKAFVIQAKKLDLMITSYALAPRDEKTLTGLTWQGLVLDEAQNIKNPDTQQTQAIRHLDATFRIALTGTPLENRLMELWSILEFLNPGYLGAKNFFQRRFATPIERYGDSASLQTLRGLVQPFMLRRLKSDRTIIQDLPDKQEMTVFCGLTSDQAKLYEQVVNDSLKEVEASSGIQRKGVILATLTKLKQVCNHPAQYLHEDSLRDSQFRSAKLQRLQEMLDVTMAEGDRALIFTQFSTWGTLLQDYLEAQFKREVLFLYGSTTQKQREEMVDRFQNDPQGPRLFILSLKAGGVGLNLTRANHVFHFDRWWNPAVENQATDRVFRIGQTRNVQVHKFVCTGTLEEKIHEQIESKKALAEQVVGGGENWLTKLDTDQLRTLLMLDRSAIIDDD